MVLKEKCGELAECAHLKEEYDACNERVLGKPNTAEKCTQELFDFLHCVDHCVSFFEGSCCALYRRICPAPWPYQINVLASPLP